MKLSHLIVTAALSFSASSYAGQYSYVEYGFGASQLHSFDNSDNASLSDFSLGGSAKLLVAGRVGRSANSWFELGAAYTGGLKHSDTEVNSQFLSAGFKFTTDPRQKLSSFLKIGGGKTFSITTTKGEADQKDNGVHYYLGSGLSFRLDNKQAVNFDIQRYIEKDSDLGINTFFVSFNHFI